MEAPSTSDFEEDEAEIAERGARAWHFFEGFFSHHRIHAESSSLCERRRSNPLSLVYMTLSRLFLPFPFPNAFRFCDRRRTRERKKRA